MWIHYPVAPSTRQNSLAQTRVHHRRLIIRDNITVEYQISPIGNTGNISVLDGIPMAVKIFLIADLMLPKPTLP